MLAGQIANLTRGRVDGVARGYLSANIGVEMGLGARAVAVSGHWLVVDVVDYKGMLALNLTCARAISNGYDAGC